MKRKFVFIWGDDVQPTIEALSAPKIEALRAHCRKLIARAEYYRQNPMQVVTIVEMAHLTDEDVPWAPFKKFGFWFKLVCHEKKKREYVLSFASPPEPEAPDGGSDEAAQSGPERRRRGAARPASVRRPPMATDKRSMSYKMAWSETKQGIEALYGSLWPPLRLSVQCMRDACGNTLSRTRPLLGEFVSRVAPILCGPSTSFRTSQECSDSGPEASLEPRLFGQNTGLHVLLYTLVWNDERIDWSADLFGTPAHGK
jgi:hypothetical protein